MNGAFVSKSVTTEKNYVQIYAQRDRFIKSRLSGIRMKLSSVTCENRMEELKKSVTLLNSLNDVPIKNVYVLRKLF